MLLVTPQERNRRLDLCKACKYYKANTQSCGTLLRPRTLRNGVKLCGCFLPAKTKFKFSECPAGFWSATVTSEDQDRIKEAVSWTGSLSLSQTRELVDIYNRVTGTTNTYTGCNACLTNMRDELKRFLEYPIDQAVKEDTARVAQKYLPDK